MGPFFEYLSLSYELFNHFSLIYWWVTFSSIGYFRSVGMSRNFRGVQKERALKKIIPSPKDFGRSVLIPHTTGPLFHPFELFQSVVRHFAQGIGDLEGGSSNSRPLCESSGVLFILTPHVQPSTRLCEILPSPPKSEKRLPSGFIQERRVHSFQVLNINSLIYIEFRVKIYLAWKIQTGRTLRYFQFSASLKSSNKFSNKVTPSLPLTQRHTENRYLFQLDFKPIT